MACAKVGAILGLQMALIQALPHWPEEGADTADVNRGQETNSLDSMTHLIQVD